MYTFSNRFQLSVRTSCPYPYADGSDLVTIPCTVGSLMTVSDGLVYSTQVANLTPFTAYEYRLNVWNRAGSADQPAVAMATTLPAGGSV